MTLLEIRSHFLRDLSSRYPEEEIRSIFARLTGYRMGLSGARLSLELPAEVTEEDRSYLEDALERLCKAEPVQYVLGHEWFLGECFQLNSETLIPRPETEELVLWIAETLKGEHPQRILDAGTGSGCIALSLKRLLGEARVFGADLSTLALEAAVSNAKAQNTEVDFFQADLLDPSWLKAFEDRPGSGLLDVLVSNPPYVRELEKEAMHANVLEHEPHTALFVPDHDPLLFYRVLAESGQHLLKPRAWFFAEINQYLGRETADLLEQLGYEEVTLREDFRGNTRMIRARKR